MPGLLKRVGIHQAANGTQSRDKIAAIAIQAHRTLHGTSTFTLAIAPGDNLGQVDTGLAITDNT
jgi:hypothetical protein